MDPKTGASIKIGDVAFVQIGPALKEGEVVGGIVIMRDGENVLRVIGELKEIIRKIELPEGVELVITYDRSKLVKEAIETTLKTLIKEILIVLVVVAIFLMNIRGSIPIILFLPTALLYHHKHNEPCGYDPERWCYDRCGGGYGGECFQEA